MALQPVKIQTPVRFGEQFEFEPRSYELRRAGRPLRLEPTPLEILLLLIERRGELVTREEIVARIWGDGIYVDTDNSINGAIRKIRQVLNDDPGKPQFIQTVSGKGYRFLAPVDLEDSKPESVPSEAAGNAEGPRQVRSSASWQRWGGVAAVGLVVAVAVTMVVLGRLPSRVSRNDSIPAAKVRRSVAVLGLQNLSTRPEQEWIATALEETISTELASGQELRVVPDESVERLKLDMSLPAASSYGRETLQKIRGQLNADYVVLGSYLASGKESGQKVRVNLQLQDTRSGEVIAAVAQDGTEVDIAELASRSGANLRAKLGVSPVPTEELTAVQITLPKNPEAARFYAEGLAKLRAYDALSARVLLEKSVAAEPGHPLSHAALAQSWSELGYDQRAREEAKRALDLSSELRREDRLAIEGRYRELSREFAAAVEIYKTLSNFFPDNVEYGIRLAWAQLNAYSAKDALDTLRRLRTLPEPQSRDPRIDLTETKVCEGISDFRRMQKAAAAASEKGQLQGSRLIVAEARGGEGRAWMELGEYDKAQSALLEAQNLFAASGNPRQSAVATNDLADLFYAKGDNAAARQAYEEAIRKFRATGAQQQLANSLSREGSLFYDIGLLAEAKKSGEEALKIDREIGNGTERDLSNLANVLEALGDLQESIQCREEALQAFRRAGDQNNEAVTLTNLANVTFKTGDIATARRELEQASAIQRGTGHKRGLGFSLFILSGVLRAQDELKQSQATAEQTIALRKELKDDLHIPESEMLLGEIKLERGESREAQALVQRAAAAFEEQKVTDLGAQAYADLARAFLVQGNVKDANAAAEHAIELAKKGGDLTADFDAKLAWAAVLGESGQTAEAARALQGLRNEVTRRHYVNYEFEVRLRLGKLELRSSRIDDGRLHLSALEHEARDKGFLLIARKASLALRNSQQPT